MMMMTRWAANVSFPTRYMAAKRIGQSISSSHIIFLCIFPFTEGLKILGAINTKIYRTPKNHRQQSEQASRAGDRTTGQFQGAIFFFVKIIMFEWEPCFTDLIAGSSELGILLMKLKLSTNNFLFPSLELISKNKVASWYHILVYIVAASGPKGLEGWSVLARYLLSLLGGPE